MPAGLVTLDALRLSKVQDALDEGRDARFPESG